MFKTVFTKSALKDFQKLEKSVQETIKNKLVFYQSDPINYSTKLTNHEIGSFRYRIGNYRVIFDIDNNNTIVVLKNWS